jgi:hypothetical protein
VTDAAVESALSLPSSEDLTAAAIVGRLGLANRVRVEHLGNSRRDRPIPMLSIGHGPHSALIVGAPHPNEPTGCLTILRMLDQLATSPTPEWQWHFIPAIDIDGIALNERWFGASPDLDAYLAAFFRPPFRLQPEYSFPIDLPTYQFRESTPENVCWQRALEITRPRLQCSLHGADTGGAFFILSKESPRLAHELAAMPTRFGVSLNEVGEPLAEMTVHRPGIFSFPSIPDILARNTLPGTAPGATWQAGDSSADFARQRFGTFSMTCEVPLWRDAREGDAGPSGRTLGEVFDERILLLREDVELVSEWLPTLAARNGSSEAESITESLTDCVPAAVGAISALEQTRPSGSGDRLLSTRELVGFEAGTSALRTPALLLRLARRAQSPVAQAAAGTVLEARLARYRRTTSLSAVPLIQTTGLQMAAVIAAARFVGAGGYA